MTIKRRIKVLVVDDSFLFREMLKKALEKDSSIEVVGLVSNAYSAENKVNKYNPQVIVLDINMPGRNGIVFLKELMPKNPIPVVAISSFDDVVFKALQAGAVDFVSKPALKNGINIKNFINELIVKIKIAYTIDVSHWKKDNSNKYRVNDVIRVRKNKKIIAVGASTGGTEAGTSILIRLPKDMPGIVVTQHMPPNFTRMYAERLNRLCNLQVKEAKSGDEIRRGRVLIAPGDKHMIVRKKGDLYIVKCFKGERVNGHCPSVDVLFNSMAEQVGKDAIGIILTGMGCDGAKGLLAMRDKGARTIGQDEKSSIVYGMPKVAYEIGAVEKQVPLQQIPDVISLML